MKGRDFLFMRGLLQHDPYAVFVGRLTYLTEETCVCSICRSCKIRLGVWKTNARPRMKKRKSTAKLKCRSNPDVQYTSQANFE